MANSNRTSGHDRSNPFASFVDRVLVGISGVLWVLLGLALVAIPLGWTPLPRLTDWIGALAADMRGVSIVLGVVLLVGGGRMWVRSLPPEREQRNVVQEGELGQLSVSVRAIETLVNRTVRQIEGIQDVGIQVNRETNGLTIKTQLSVTSEQSMPDVAQQVQEKVREAVQSSVGIEVQRVDVGVRNVVGGSKQHRVEKDKEKEQEREKEREGE